MIIHADIDLDTVKKFLKFITSGYDCKCFWELRCFKRDRKFDVKSSKFFENSETFVDFIVKNQERLSNLNCYVGVCPRYVKSRGDKSVKLGNTIVIDLDSERSIEDSEKIYDELCLLNLQPSLIGNSGHGIHIYWKLKNPINSKKWSAFQRSFISFFMKKFGRYYPDIKIKNPERLTRIYGTVNNKDAPVSTSLIIDNDAIYDATEIGKILDSSLHAVSQPQLVKELRSTKLDNEDSKRKLRDLKIQELLSRENPEFKSLGQGIHNGVFYFGTKIYDENNKPHDAVVTSDRKIYVDWGVNNEIKDEFGLNYEYEFFDNVLENRWSNKSIKEWLGYKSKKITLREVYEKIVAILKLYMEFSDDRWYKFVALDIISTFLNEIFDAIGRTLFKGEKGSGKTKACLIYRQLAFNPMMSPDWTKSSIFRAIESTKGTPIIDNFDDVSEDLNRDVMAIYRAYKKGVKSIRTEGERKRMPTGFNLLCKIVLNNILGLDEVSEDRSNIITLIRSNNIEITNRKIIFDDPIWSDVRDSLFICALENWKKVKEAYEEMRQQKLIGRQAEVVEPILSIAKCISEDLLKEMIDFELEKIEQKKIKELSDDWIYTAMKVVVRILGDEKEKEIKLTQITEEAADMLFDFGRKDEKMKRSLAIALGKKFKSHPLFKGRMMNGSAYYTFKRENVIKFCRLMDYDDLVDLVDNVDKKSTQSSLESSKSRKEK